MSILPSKQILARADGFILRDKKTGVPVHRNILAAIEPESRGYIEYRIGMAVVSFLTKLRYPGSRIDGMKIMEVKSVNDERIPNDSPLMVKTDVGNYRLIGRDEISKYTTGTKFYTALKA